MNFTRRKALKTALLGVGAAALSTPVWAQQKPPIKIGVISPLTGAQTANGQSQRMLLKMAMDDINAKGGINGSALQLEFTDAQVDPGQAVLLFRKFVSDGFFGVVGPMTGTQWETITPLANTLQMPAVSVNAIKPGITKRPWTLRLMPPDDTLMPEGVKAFLAAYPNVKKVVVTADVREASSKASADSFGAIAKQNGVEVLDTIGFSSLATDMSAVAIQIKSKNPDAIFAASFPPQAILLSKDLTIQQVNVPVLNTSLLWTGPFINRVGPNGKNWHVIGLATNEAGPPGYFNQALYLDIVKRAQAQADATVGLPFNLCNWHVSYDAALFYADIMRRTGIDGNTDVKKARELIKDQFMAMKEFSGVYKYSIRETGDGHIPATVLFPDIANKKWSFSKVSA
jgi:ABC-type branched-subunit amino acid transport system substrate-binding protein